MRPFYYHRSTFYPSQVFVAHVAYASTFNSAQGLMLDKVVLNLQSPLFSHGQELYTRLTIIQNRSAALVIVPKDMDTENVASNEEHVLFQTKNIVYAVFLL
ncbi:hypothetical protein BX070DRAFT_51293 [Coemansia spiralis]|nr:hypothetical protein BX070DRAFT_51293 [Coemansia spiralis]